jgi:hypothetical protein
MQPQAKEITSESLSLINTIPTRDIIPKQTRLLSFAWQNNSFRQGVSE